MLTDGTVTTCMVALVAILVWRFPAYLVVPVWLFFAALDGAFLSAVFEKVPDGAWFTLMLALILAGIFALWRFGKEAQWSAESLGQLTARSLFNGDTASGALRSEYGGAVISTVPGLGIFFDKAGDAKYLPVCFVQFVTKFAVRPAVVVFFHMRPLPVPSIQHDRYIITRVAGMAGCYNVVLRHGYMDDVLHPGMARDLVDQIDAAVSLHRQTAETEREIQALRAAKLSQIVYILGKEAIKIRWSRKGSRSALGILRGCLFWVFLWIRENSRAKVADLDIDLDKLVEVGFVKEI